MGEGGNKPRTALPLCLTSKLLGEKENKFKKLVLGKFPKCNYINLIFVNYYFFLTGWSIICNFDHVVKDQDSQEEQRKTSVVEK